MKFKSVLLLAVAVSCGLVAMLGVRQVLSGSGDEQNSQEVLVAIAEIKPGMPLDETNVALRELPNDLVPADAVANWEEIEERSVKTGAMPGDVITTTRLSEMGLGASHDIPIGLRLVSVPVNLTKTHSGLIRPGDRVDLQVTYKVPTPDFGMVAHTKTFLEYIEVFATDSLRHIQGSGEEEVQAKNISLLVTPEQANVVQLAQSEGQINLVLRNKGDKKLANAKSADGQLFGEFRVQKGAEEESTKPESVQTADVKTFIDQQTSPAADPVPVDITPVWKLRIYRGGEEEVQEIEFEKPEELAMAPTAALDADSISWKGLFRMIGNDR